MLLALLTACSSSGVSGGNTQTNSAVIELPDGPSVSDVYKQVVWFDPGGGGYPGPITNCSQCEVTGEYSSEISLTGFSPNQSLILVFYTNSGRGPCGNISDFMAAWQVQVNSNGNLTVSIKNWNYDISLYSVYDSSTNELLWQHRLLLGDPNCTN